MRRVAGAGRDAGSAADYCCSSGPGATLDAAALHADPEYSTVAGVLPLEDTPRLDIGGNADATAVVRCKVEASTPGPVVLRLNTPQGLRLWLDRKPVEVKKATPGRAGRRPHADVCGGPQAAEEPLRCAGEQPGSPAQGAWWGK